MQDSDPAVRRAAAFALAKVDPAGRDAVPELVAALPDRAGLELRWRYDPRLDDLRPPVRVPLQVRVPPDTPRDRPVCVATSADWQRHQPLAWSEDEPDTATGFVEVPRGQSFFYKYTRGDWESVEKWSGCAEAANRYAFGAAHPGRRDVVEGWRDRCPAGG